MLGFYIHGMLQNLLKHRRRGRHHDRTEGDQDAHKNPTRPVITRAQHDEDFSYHDKTNQGYRTIFYRPQSLHGCLRKYLILSGIPQQLERLIECHEKWNGSYICIRQERIVEVDLEGCGVCISTFDV